MEDGVSGFSVDCVEVVEEVDCVEGVEGANGGREVDSACGVCPSNNQPVGIASIRIDSAIRRIFLLRSIS